jgi:hypothetical protein
MWRQYDGILHFHNVSFRNLFSSPYHTSFIISCQYSMKVVLTHKVTHPSSPFSLMWVQLHNVHTVSFVLMLLKWKYVTFNDFHLYFQHIQTLFYCLYKNFIKKRHYFSWNEMRWEMWEMRRVAALGRQKGGVTNRLRRRMKKRGKRQKKEL